MGVVASGLCFCCSAASCACSAVSCCFSGGMGPNGVRASVAKFNYVMLLGLSTLLALVVRTYGGDIEAFGFSCGDELVDGIAITCSGNAAVYRISFVMVLFFTLMFIGMVYVPTFTGDRRWAPMLGEGFHRGFWGPKIFIYVAALLACFFIPSEGFDDVSYAWVARVVSILFLIVQVLVLIDFAYQWDADWIDRAYDGDEVVNAGWRNAVIACSFILYALTIGGFVILFTFYNDCPSGTAFSVITVISVVVFTLITLFRDRIVGEDYVGSILPASVVSFYVTYLAWSALESSEDVKCRPLGGNNDGAVIALGSIFAIIALMWTSFTISKRAGNLVRGVENEEDAGVGGLYTIEDANGETTTAREADAAESGNSGNKVALSAETTDSELDTGDRAYIFHLIMITASMYMSMLLTNWGTRGIELVVEQNGTTNADVEELFGASVGQMNMWVKIVAQWVAILLYVWTLVAPRVLSNCREF